MEVMHRKYIHAATRGRTHRGFSLVEMLVVISIMMILMASSSVLLKSPVSKAGEPSARLARCIEMARATAVAANRTVVLRFETPVGRERDLTLRFYSYRPGLSSDAKPEQFRRAERFTDIRIASGIDLGTAAKKFTGTHELADGESIVLTTDGQTLIGTGTEGLPTVADDLVPMIDVGLQATVSGKVIDSVRRDVAIVRIQPASGTATALQP